PEDRLLDPRTEPDTLKAVSGAALDARGAKRRPGRDDGRAEVPGADGETNDAGRPSATRRPHPRRPCRLEKQFQAPTRSRVRLPILRAGRHGGSRPLTGSLSWTYGFTSFR